MNPVFAISPVGVSPSAAYAAPMVQATNVLSAAGSDFGSILAQGIATMDAKVAAADRMVLQFALDDNVPIHQVTIALEEARMAVELAIQVRQRLVEGYRELMNMQL